MIKVTSRLGGEADVEAFADIEALEAELELTAEPVYAAKILARLRNGEQKFDIGNGPDTDTYEVVDDT